MSDLKKLFALFQKNKMGFEDIYNYFNNYILYLIKTFNIDLYGNELLIKLWKLSLTINIELFKTDEELVKYIKVSLKNYSKTIYNKQKAESKTLFNSDIVNLTLDKSHSDNSNHCSEILFNELIDTLPAKQKKIIKLRYKYELSDSEIASLLNLSRQAVHGNRKSALHLLHSSLISERG